MHGLPGLRIGWLASRDPAFLGSVSRLKDYTTICPAAPSELLATMALRSQAAIISANRLRISRGKAALRDLVTRQAEHLHWSEPQVLASPHNWLEAGWRLAGGWLEAG